MKLELPFRKQASVGWLAVSLGEGRARFAHVKPGPRPAVISLEEREWDNADANALERVIKQVHASRHRCTTLLGQPDYQILLVEAPNVKREELKAAVRWRIKDMIDYHVHDATIDVLDVPAAAAPQRPATMYVVVTKNQMVQQLVDRFDAAGIALAVIDIPDTAQRNIAALYESPGRALLTLSFDPDGGLTTITSGGELYVSRRLDIPYAQVNGDGDAHTRAFDRVLVEVQRSPDHFERNFSQLAVERVLVAPMAQCETLVAHIAANLQVPVVAMDLADVMDLPPLYLAATPDRRALWFRLIGAGLRVEPTVL
jgi:MSHA biogenesis protein MshI